MQKVKKSIQNVQKSTVNALSTIIITSGTWRGVHHQQER
uniref:Uncharacterized protein n=1 Tax=Romanomermis culicivorax TaxID=13658 RepID=A0A915KQY5_ROMCU